MLTIRITGLQLRTGRVSAGLSQQELADRCGLSRPCISLWEHSSHALPNGRAPALNRAITALEQVGIEFAGDGAVTKHPTESIVTTTSEAIAP